MNTSIKTLVARGLRSECCLWVGVLTFSSLYAHWLCYGDTRLAQRMLAKGVREVRAYLPGDRAASRRATQQIETVNREVIETVSQAPHLKLPAGSPLAGVGGSTQKKLPEFRKRDDTPPGANRDAQVVPIGLTASGIESADGAPSREIVRTPSLGATSFEEGLTSFQRGDFGQAVRGFQAAAFHVPDRAAYRYFLALSQYRVGRRSEASRHLVRATELEAIALEPDLGRLLERVQGPGRIWLESASRAVPCS